MKAIIFARVSSREQEDGYSLNAQAAKMKQYCLYKQLQVIKEYEIVESSSIGDRKKFNEMLDMAAATSKESKSPVAIIIDKIDRLMRNFKDYPRIMELVENEVCELHIVGDNAVINKKSTSAQKMIMQFGVMMAESYINAMKDNRNRSIEYKVKQGEYPAMAPIGYLNVPKQQGSKSAITLDPNRFILVRRLFVEYATGAYTLGDMEKLAESWGLRNKNKKQSKLNKSHIHEIIRSKFYFGVANYKGSEYQHTYPTIIDEAIYHRCQEVTAKHNKKPFNYSAKEYLFRGLITCSKCGCAYSSDTKKGKYTYLRPTKSKGKCDCFAIKEETVLEQVKGVFKLIHIPEQFMEQIRVYLKKNQQTQMEYQNSVIDDLTKQSKAIVSKLDKLVDLLVEQSITQDIYDKKVYEQKQKQADIAERLKAHSNADADFYNSLGALLELASRAYELFERSETAQKRKLINFLFTNLQMDGSKLSYALRSPFNELVKLPDNQEWWDRDDSNIRPSV